MRGRIVGLLTVVLLTSSPGIGNAQQDDVQQAVMETLTAWNSGDVVTFARYYRPDARGFFIDGGPLLPLFNEAAIQAAYAAGFKPEVEIKNLDTRSFGEVAVAVAYLQGSITIPGGVVEEGTWRYSETRVRENGVWKIVQYHFSKMTAPPPGL